MSDFAKRVYAVVSRIHKGETMTYKQVAQKLGQPNASRAVGSALAQNRDKAVPCHRVIRSDGKIGDYNGLRGDKAALLRQEGALF